MSWRNLSLPPGAPGTMWLSAMPGRAEPWGAFLARARAKGLDALVCLTPLQEVRYLSPAYAHAVSEGRLPFDWVHLPMPDFGVSEQAQAYGEGVRRIAARLRDGEVLLMHCAAGIGRTGTTAACVLRCLGVPTVAALHAVQAAGSNPQSGAQWDLVEGMDL